MGTNAGNPAAGHVCKYVGCMYVHLPHVALHLGGFLSSGPQETSQNTARDSICCIEKKTILIETQVTRLAYQGIICDTKAEKEEEKKKRNTQLEK